MNLKPDSAIVNTLLKKEVCSNHIKLILDKNTEIEIPRDSLRPKDIMKYIGAKIGVFHCSDGSYHINSVWKENKEYYIFKGKFGTTIVKKIFTY